MQIVPATCNAAAHILRVILEVHGEDGLGLTIAADAVHDGFALLGRGQQLRRSGIAHGHVVEEPHEQCAGIDHVIEEFFAGNIGVVFAGVAGGNAEGQLVFLQQPHGIGNLLVYTFAATTIVGILEALQRNGGHKVLHPQHLPAEVLVDQRAVGEGQKFAVRVHLAQLDQISLAYQRLAAGVDVEIGAHFLALTDDGIDGLQTQVQVVAVLGSPAAGTMQVAGRGGVQQDRPRHIAAFLLFHLILNSAALQAGVEQKVFKKCFAHSGIQLVKL